MPPARGAGRGSREPDRAARRDRPGSEPGPPPHLPPGGSAAPRPSPAPAAAHGPRGPAPHAGRRLRGGRPGPQTPCLWPGDSRLLGRAGSVARSRPAAPRRSARSPQQRLAREHDPSLRDCPHLTGEAPPAERVERRLVEPERLPEPGTLVLVEAKTLEERQAVLQARGHQEPTAGRKVA